MVRAQRMIYSSSTHKNHHQQPTTKGWAHSIPLTSHSSWQCQWNPTHLLPQFLSKQFHLVKKRIPKKDYPYPWSHNTTPSQFLGLYQVQNWQDIKVPEVVNTTNNCIRSPFPNTMPIENKQGNNNSNMVSQLQKQTTCQDIKDTSRKKLQKSTVILKQPSSSRRKEDTPSPALFSVDKPKFISPHKRTWRNIATSKYARLRAILEKLKDQEYSPNFPHTKNKKENKNLHHF